MRTSERSHFPFFTLQMQPIHLAASGLTKLSRIVLFVSIATRAGSLIAVLAWGSFMMRREAGVVQGRAGLDR